MSSTVSIYVAIYNDGGVYKHWGLFIDEPQEADKMLLHVKGSDGRFRYEPEARDARRSASLVELVYLCGVNVTKISAIKSAASKVIVHNEVRGWNCQDYVLDLLDALEKEAIVSNQDAGYRNQKILVRGKQEGLA